MKRYIILLLTAVSALTLQAQGLRFATFSYEQVLQAMPDYVQALQNLSQLRAQYDAETKRTEDEFNVKYEEFLEVQASLAPTIRNKRQMELQEMMGRGITFKQEAKRLLQQAENDALSPVKARLAAAIRKIGAEQGYAFILNTDGNTVPYINTALGEDITDTLKKTLSE